MGVHWEKVMGGGSGGGGSCFVFWKVTELLRDTSIKCKHRVNSLFQFFLVEKKKGKSLK